LAAKRNLGMCIYLHKFNNKSKLMIDPVQKQKQESMGGAENASPAAVNLTNNPDAEAEYVPLPSRGRFYKGPFKNLTMIKVRKLNFEDEDILTTKSFYDNGTLFNEILKNTIVDENGFPSKELTNADKDAILWWLRIGAFGREYEVPHVCNNPECKKKYNIMWDLGSFSMPDYPAECEQEIFDNGCRTIKLPVSGLEVKLVPPAIGKEIDIHKRLTLKKEKTNASRDFNTTGKLLSVIQSATDAEGNVYTGVDQINKWLLTSNKGGKISMSDSRYIQEKAREIDLEVDTRQDVQCKFCGHVEEGVKMPMSIYFFWPEYAKISGVSNQVD